MKAMVLDEIAPVETSPLHLREVPDPQPGPGEVRVRVRCCAVCRTDLHVIEGDLPREKMPIIPGHQIVGVIDAMGPEGGSPASAGRRLRVGQRVGVAWLRHTCGRCAFCQSGRENLCAQQRFTGYHADGGYAELAVAPADYVYELPEAFGDVEAAPLLCAGIVGYRALKRSNLPRGGRLAIYGFGSSAHVILQIARHRGSEVYVVTRGQKHRELARSMGAAWVGERAEDLPVQVDSAILFAPAGEIVPAALEKVTKGGTLAIAGIYLSDIPVLNYDRHLFFERDLRSVTANTREDGREFLAEAAAIHVRPHTTVYPLADANRALQDVKADRVNGTAVLTIAD
jgi:propanol-preferring alcohol dehydrogenase